MSGRAARSPGREADRRRSVPSGGSLASRITDPGTRTMPDNANIGGRNIAKEPPRGPKALRDPPRGPGPGGGGNYIPAGPRGRGIGGRGEPRDRDRDLLRDVRDPRDTIQPRPERERDWDRWDRDSGVRSRRPSPSSRPRTPPLREPRDSRDSRDPRSLASRDADVNRARRDSRDGPLSATSSVSDHAARGGGYSRGWDDEIRSQGRDWAPIRARSRSREQHWERDRGSRDRHRSFDRTDDRYGSREEERRKDREDREREAERWKREQPTPRNESRNLSGSLTTPTTPHPLSAASSHPASTDRTHPPDLFRDLGSGRRVSTTAIPASSRDSKREVEKPDYFASRAEASRDRYSGRTSSPPPQAPQVPAFGSFTYRSSSLSGPAANTWKAPTTQATTTANVAAVPKAVPTGPKAQILGQAPTGPRAARAIERPVAADVREIAGSIVDEARVKRPVPPLGAPSQNQFSNRLHADAPNQAIESMPHLSDSLGTPLAKSRAPPTGPQNTSRPTSSSSAQPFAKVSSDQSVLSGRMGSPGRPKTPTGRVSAFNTSPQSLGMNIPTGPKANRIPPLMPRAPLHGRGNQWIRPGAPVHPQRSVAPISSIPAKRDQSGEEKSRIPSKDDLGVTVKPGSSVPSTALNSGAKTTIDEAVTTKAEEGRNSDKNDKGKVMDSQPIGDNKLGKRKFPRIRLVLRTPPPVPEPVEEDAPDNIDEDMGLDEQDYAESEANFAREMAALEQKKLRLIFDDQEFMNLFCQVRDVSRMLDEFGGNWPSPPAPESALAQESVRPGPLNLPSPKLEEVEDAAMDDDDPPLREIAINRLPTPPIEDLPFLDSGIPTSIADLDIYQENLRSHRRIQKSFTAEILDRRQLIFAEEEDLRRAYSNAYRPYRLAVREIDRDRRPVSVEPNPPLPQLDISPSIPSAATIEGRRGGKFGSELDFERVLKESEQTAREERERQEREVKARADLEKEAVIPPMLNEYDRQMQIFKDTNGLIPEAQILNASSLVPARDTFSAEEQKVFIENFMAYPKRWGRIAEALPGRDYHDCIEHYYLTKGEANYKKRLSKRTTKKGRKAGPAAQGRPKSNALMSDLGVKPSMYDGEDVEPLGAQITDSGRPRRAAAPTFGEAPGEAELSTPAPTPARKVAAPPKGDVNAENGLERSVKRTKTAAPREKGQKRGKNQLLAAAPGPSPQKSDREKVKTRETPKPEESRRAKDFEDANLLATLQAGSKAGLTDRQASFTEDWYGQPVQNNGSMDIARQSQQQQQIQQQQQQQQKTAATSSYWSVPDQQVFPKLIAHFGTDWNGIANWMTTKTHIMVKNYYNRLVVDQRRTDLEEEANQANARRERGEPMGPPPVPTIVPKRRYETPQPVVQRPLAPSMEPMEIEDDSPRIQPAIPLQTSPPTFAPRFPPLAQAVSTPSQAQATVAAPPQHPLAERPVSVQQPQPTSQPPRATQRAPGPHLGYFPDSRAENRPILQAQPAQQHPQSLQQPPRIQPAVEDLAQRQRQTIEQQKAMYKQESQEASRRIEHQMAGQRFVEPPPQQQQPPQQPQPQPRPASRQPPPPPPPPPPPSHIQQQQQQQQHQQQQHEQQQGLQRLHQRQQLRSEQAQGLSSISTRGPPEHHSSRQTPITEAHPIRQTTAMPIQREVRPLSIQPQHMQPPRPPPPPAPSSSQQQQQSFTSAPSSMGNLIEPDRQPSRRPVSPSHHNSRNQSWASVPKDQVRPSSTPAQTAPQSMPRPPQETVQKKSNIFDVLLNNEPEEPRPKKRYSDHISSAPTPPPQSPGPQIYSAPPVQPPQVAPRREMPKEPQTSMSYQRTGYSAPHPAVARTSSDIAPSNLSSIAQSNQAWYQANQRQSYQPPQPRSPPLRPSYAQSTQPPFQSLQISHAPSPPPPFTHSRGSSYSQPLQHQSQVQHSGPPASTQALKPSPYGPPQHIQPHPHQPRSQPQQMQPQSQPPPSQAHNHISHRERENMDIARYQQEELVQRQNQMLQEQVRHDHSVQAQIRQQQAIQHEQRIQAHHAQRQGGTNTPPQSQFGSHSGYEQRGYDGRGFEGRR
ncbi:MAG: hypothetical protein M1812_007407 [Candelaria pacifica]|nr:MAG: hypothetical protein M1812_007407 [Candelaria pacifica]